MRGLALGKAYYPNLDPSPLTKGFPQFNTDGSPFDKRSYSRVVKQTRYSATKIANSLKLATLQNGYDSNNEEVLEDEPSWVDLLQSYKTQKMKAPSSSTPNIAPTELTQRTKKRISSSLW